MEKIKQLIETDKGKDILVIFIIIFVGLGAFGLGRLSKNQPEGLKIDYKEPESGTSKGISLNDDSLDNSRKNTGNYFASIKGSKFYSISCNAGKTIKEENRIYFKDTVEAENAGYLLSSSCK